MKRIYQHVIEEHLKFCDQMIFIAGPRQVGKTTIATSTKTLFQHTKFLNWDKLADREQIVSETFLLQGLPLDAILKTKPLIIFDEIHKYSKWKIFLKGLIDEYKTKLNIIVTGSCKLDVYRKGGDSLMGRYLLYNIHPISVAELLRTSITNEPISMPKEISNDLYEALLEFGGFPEPFIKQNKRFYTRWKNLRYQQMLKEDIRDSSQIHEISQLELLSHILQYQSAQLLNYSSLSKKIRVSDQTIRRWIELLKAYYYCFIITPWYHNISRSLLKEPKIYLWDWSIVEDKGGKIENFIACHLFKAVNFWSDTGLGKYNLHYLRDKDKKEVDFLVTENNKPWFLVEVKSSAKESISKNLYYFQKQTGAKHAFQVVFDLPYVDKDCFTYTKPIIVPAKTFLSQLI
jgi:predicted AAA+ superfamily ATPase